MNRRWVKMQENIEKAKTLYEALERTGLDKELSDTEKATVKMGTIMGADPVRMMVGILSQHETEEAERETPQPKIEETDPLKRRIIGLLTESTGTDIMDSGGAYGRSWQRNRKVTNWDDRPATTVEVYDGEVILTADIYHFLLGHLEIPAISEQLDEEFQKFMEQSDECYLTDMQDFTDEKHQTRYGRGPMVINSYNGENHLSQVIQYVLFEYDGEGLIALQVHGGCDVRGGYTKPCIFATEHDYFIIHQTHENAYCKGCDASWWTDDTYHWYSDDGVTEGTSTDLPEDWETHPDENMVTHKGCDGGEIEFYVMNEY